MEQKYEDLEMEVIVFDSEDIMTASDMNENNETNQLPVG